MAKKIKTIIKIQCQAGKANPAPPIGTALGPQGVNIMDFCTKFNQATQSMMGYIIPAEITVYEDRTFVFKLKKPPVSELIKKSINLAKGSGIPNREKVGKLSKDQVNKIAEEKMPDLNANDLEAAKKIVIGTARSMGVEIEK